MATANMHNSLTMRVSSEYFSATFLTLLLFIILFVPIIYIATIGVQYLSTIDANIITKITHKITALAENIPILNDWLTEHLSDEKILDTVKTSTKHLQRQEVKVWIY